MLIAFRIFGLLGIQSFINILFYFKIMGTLIEFDYLIGLFKTSSKQSYKPINLIYIRGNYNGDVCNFTVHCLIPRTFVPFVTVLMVFMVISSLQVPKVS